VVMARPPRSCVLIRKKGEYLGVVET